TPGVRLFGTGNIVEFNQINANYGAGVLVYSTSAQNRISKNSIFDNGTVPTLAGGSASGQIGIDLLTTADNPTNNTSSTAAKLGITPYVSLNDTGDGDTGGNGVLNYPVITGAALVSGNLTLTGFAQPGAEIELFLAAADSTGFGEGKTYLMTLFEGSGAD